MKKLFKKKKKLTQHEKILLKKYIKVCGNTNCNNNLDRLCNHKKDLALCDGFIPVKEKVKQNDG